jgi:hypothetical protein
MNPGTTPDLYQAINPTAWFFLAFFFGTALVWIGIWSVNRLAKILTTLTTSVGEIKTKQEIQSVVLENHAESIDRLEEWRNNSHVVRQIPINVTPRTQTP